MTSTRFGFGDFQYEVVPEWGLNTDMGIVSDVATDSNDRVYLAVRNTPHPEVLGGAILVFDRDGHMIDSWGEGLFTTPHGIWISKEDKIFLADSSDHTVRSYTNDGRLEFTIGTQGKTGEPGYPFNRPTRAALSNSGTLFVSDGYGQDRIHKFTNDGKWIMSFGETGKGSGFLNLPHDVTIGNDDQVYVLDRENRRCQVFDQDGKYEGEFEGLRSPNDMVIDESGFFHVAEGWYQEIASICVMSSDGTIIGRWGGRGDGPGYFKGAPHGLWIDSKGDIYIAEVAAEKAIHKFARI
jgi:sugar lactone lactonase YvrE